MGKPCGKECEQMLRVSGTAGAGYRDTHTHTHTHTDTHTHTHTQGRITGSKVTAVPKLNQRAPGARR